MTKHLEIDVCIQVVVQGVVKILLVICISCCGSGEKGLGIAVVGFIDAW